MLKYWKISFIIRIFLLSFHPIPSQELLQGGLGSEDEMRLIDNLFVKQGYNPLIRPVQILNESLIVAFNMALIQLITVDEKNQILLTNVWLRMTWHDYQLEWDPYEYGGITVIRMKSEEVWKPDIVLFNNADGRYEVSYKSNVVLSYTGEILWIPPAIYKSSCTIDVEYFPFDEQECEMKFGSWTFNGDQVRLGWYDDKQKIDLSDYVQSGTWDVMSCPGNLSLEFDSKDGHNKSFITYTIKIRRKTLFYTTNLIVPCILISFLSICVFFLPADALEKMTLCISILLALVVFLLLVLKILPPTSQTVPLIAKYLLFTFIMNLMTIFLTVAIINWNFRTPRTHKMPPWVRSVFLNYLPRVIFMKRPNHDSRFGEKAYSLNHYSQPTKSKDNLSFKSSKSNLNNEEYYSHKSEVDLRTSQSAFSPFLSKKVSTLTRNSAVVTPLPTKRTQKSRRDSIASIDGIPICHETIKALEAVRFVATHLRNENDYSEVLDDWRYIALVIDRLQLFIFFVVTICGTIGILLNAPHIFEYVDQDAILRNILANKQGIGE